MSATPQRTFRQRARQHGRAAALDALAFAAERSGQTERGLARPRVHFLFLHRIRPGEEQAFRNLVTETQRNHQVVSYTEAVHRVKQGRIDGRYACFSFDDGFASCLTAARVLEEEGATGCFFVCPDLTGLDREQIVPTLPNIGPFERGSLTWDELEMMRAQGHEIGSHTLSHPVIGGVPDDEAARQIIESRETLVSRIGSGEHFAWPRGRFQDFSPAAREFVGQAGYLSCASAMRGAHTVGSTPDTTPCFRRENIDLAWPTRHVRYFIGRSGLRSSASDNLWPESWGTAPDRAA